MVLPLCTKAAPIGAEVGNAPSYSTTSASPEASSHTGSSSSLSGSSSVVGSLQPVPLPPKLKPKNMLSSATTMSMEALIRLTLPMKGKRMKASKLPPPANPRSKLVVSALDHENSLPAAWLALLPVSGTTMRSSLPPSRSMRMRM